MRQLFTQSQHVSAVIARRHLEAPDWTRQWTRIQWRRHIWQTAERRRRAEFS